MAKRTCSIAGCDRILSARGWCATHYVRWKTHGTTDLLPKAPRPVCAVDDCERISAKRGWCETHYRRWQRHGDPTRMTENRVPLVDEDPRTDERWLPVVGYEGLYEVSDHGRVRSLDRYVTRRGKPMRHRGRLLRLYRQADGRPSVNLARDGVSRTLLVPVLVLAAFVGPRPSRYECCHNDGDASNNRLDNLRWDTKSGNMLDKVKHGNCSKRNRMSCPLGHALQAPNLVASVAEQGHRACLACSRARSVTRKARIAGRPFDLKATADQRYAKIMEAAGLAIHDPASRAAS